MTGKTKPQIGFKVDEEDDMIEVSVKLTSGKFESTVRLPLDADYEHIEAALGNWWQTLESMIKCRKKDIPKIV